MTDKTSSSLQSTSPASSRTSSPSVSSQSSSASSQTSSPESESSTSGKSSLSVHSIKLLPCRVCGRRASGFHYGVNTCEACKVFFRRGLQQSKTYICKNSGRCWDTVGRKKCTACRYKKCVDIGMSKAAIKTGRYSHQKRTKVILEVQELERSRGISQDPQAPAPKATSTDQPLDLFPDPEYMTGGTEMRSGCDIDTLTGSDIAAILDTTRDSGTLPESGMSDPAMVIGSQIVLGSNAVDGLETVFESKMETGSDSEFDVMHGSDIVAELDKIISDDMMPGLSIPASNTRLSPLGSTSEILSGLNPGTEILSGSELNIASGSNTVTRSVAVPSPTVSYGSNISTGNMVTVVQKQDLISLAFSLASKALDWLITSNKVGLDELLQPEDRIPTSSQELVSKSISSTTRKSVVAKIPLMTPTAVTTEMEDFDTFVSFLVEEHKRTVVSNTGMPPEYLLQQQRLHFEEFQQREEMYGPLSPLPYEDYIDFLEKTGIEIDNRSELMNYFVPWMEFSMRTYVGFAKLIPGFKDLCVEDRANLIKVAELDFWFLGTFPGYNNDLKVARLPCGKCFHVKELTQVWDKDFMNEAFRLAKTFQKLPLLLEEFMLLKCLVVVASDRCKLKDKRKVEDIQWKITQCLLRLLHKNHPTERNLLARVIDRLTELRSFAAWSMVIARNLEIWPCVYQYPLLLELFPISRCA